MAVESVSGSAWNHCPDVRGMGVRGSVESAVTNLVNSQALISHAQARLADEAVEYPVRAAWRSVVEKKPLYGNGSDGRM